MSTALSMSPRPTRPRWAVAVAATILLVVPGVQAQDVRGLPTIALPAELRPFVVPGTRPIAVERGDLNGDGRADVVLVLERVKVRPTDDDIEDRQRPILLLVRQADGSLRLAARNDTAAYCSSCGGMMGDPFVGVEVKTKTFTVANYGGSAWRWSAEFRFDYSRRDDAWQLVQVTESSFHTSDPDKAKTTVRKPPRDFGKIDFAEFDPQHYRGRGAR